MNVAGIDYSSHAVDIVQIPLDDDEPPRWERFELKGADAFDRARQVGVTVPQTYSVFWDDVLAVGIEHPGGKHGTGALLRMQGAVLACIPPRMLVHPLPPGKWRKLVGLKGNAGKDAVAFFAVNDGTRDEFRDWPQDACDAYCIALATRSLIEQVAA